MSSNPKDNQFNEDVFQFAGNTLFSGTGFIFLFVIIIGIVILVAYLGDNANVTINQMGQDEEKVNNLFIFLFVGIILIIAIMGGTRYYFGTDVYAYINNLFGEEPEIDVVINHKTIPDEEPEKSEEDYELPEQPKAEPLQEQVFNIPGNYYNYESAKNLCAAYDARLAKYEEIEDAYQNGAEWCNYGWSDGQMALFPTQPSTYTQLQGIEGHENDCGRPGINGGIIENPKVQFGVNCFGKKPPIDDDEKFLMENQTRFPKTKKDKARDKQIERMKKNLGNILVSPYNSQQWSRY